MEGAGRKEGEREEGRNGGRERNRAAHACRNLLLPPHDSEPSRPGEPNRPYHTTPPASQRMRRPTPLNHKAPPRAERAHLHDVHSMHHTSEDGVLVVKPGGGCGGDEELRAVGARPRVGHRNCEGPVVAQRAVELILELVAPDRGASSAVAQRVPRLTLQGVWMAQRYEETQELVHCRGENCQTSVNGRSVVGWRACLTLQISSRVVSMLGLIHRQYNLRHRLVSMLGLKHCQPVSWVVSMLDVTNPQYDLCDRLVSMLVLKLFNL